MVIDAVLRMVALVVLLYLGCWALVLAWLAIALTVEQIGRRARRVVDPVGQAFADEVGIALSPEASEHARLRALAAADGAEAAFVTPGRQAIDAFLAELFPRSKNAPKEKP